MRGKTKSRYLYILIPAILVGLVFLFLFAAGGYAPFGAASLANNDANVQYLDFFMYLKDVLEGRNSIGYTFSKMLGGSNLALFSYYLASPLNLLLVFFRKTQILTFYNLLVMLKAMLAAGAFSAFLTGRFQEAFDRLSGKNSEGYSCIFYILLPMCYGLSQYVLSQSRNVIWLDGVYMLPLMLLGVYRVVRGDRIWKLTVPVTLSILFNWYTAGINCLFTAFWAVLEYLLWCAEEPQAWKRACFFKSVLRYIISMVLGVLCSAVLFFPAALSMSGAEKGRLYFGFLRNFSLHGSVYTLLESSVYGGVCTSERLSLFCGTLVLAGVLYALSQKKHAAQRWILAGGLAFIVLMYYWTPLYSLFNLLENPSSHWSRFSYVQIFYLVFIAAWGFINGQDEGPGCRFVFAVVGYIVLLIAAFVHDPYEKSSSVWMTAASLTVMAALLILTIKKKRSLGASVILIGLLAILCVTDLSYNAKLLMDRYHRTDGEETVKYIQEQDNLIRSIQERDREDYRITQTSNRVMNRRRKTANYNEAVAYGYWSVSEYASTVSDLQLNYLERSGYRNEASTMNIVNTSILGIDSLLGVRYVLSDYPINGLKLIDSLPTVGEKRAYENPFALPIAMIGDHSLTEKENNPRDGATEGSDSTEENPFEYQNMLYSELTGERTNLYIPLEYEIQNGEDAKKDGEKTYLLSIPQGNYAIYGNLPWYYTGSGTPTLELNGSMEIEYNSWLSPSVFYIPTITGETEARVTSKGNVYTAEGTEQFYALDLDQLGNVTEKIRTASAGVSAEIENGHLTVSATAAGDGERLILTVPRDAGWKILKNGESVQPYVWEGLFYVFELNEGSNTIEMNYHVPFVREGAVISLLALVILALYPDRRKSAKNAVQRDG